MRWTCAALLALAISGCGGDGDEGRNSGGDAKKPGSMKTADLHGKWNIDLKQMTQDRMATDEEFQKLPPEEKDAKSKAMMEEIKDGSMAIEFSEGKFVMTSKGLGRDDKVDVAWKVLSQEAAKWKMETKEEGKEKVETFDLEWIDKDHVKLTKEGEDVVMHLHRAK